jgi:CubicO group peptidase (beta-lactamase class C family)
MKSPVSLHCFYSKPWIFITMLLSLYLASFVYAENTVIYSGIPQNTFLKKWLLLGPVPILPPKESKLITDVSMRDFFVNDQLASVGGEGKVVAVKDGSVPIGKTFYSWRLEESLKNTMDLSGVFDKKDTMIAYGYAEIEVTAPIRRLMTVGSDDAVRIWLNGKLIHDNWLFRVLEPDNDRVILDLKSGRNRLLIKVLNSWGGWGFACRFPSKIDLLPLLNTAAAQGRIDQVKQLIEVGVPVNSSESSMLTAWQFARLHGRKSTCDYLETQGADAKRTFPSLQKMIDQQMSYLFKGDNSGAAVLIASRGKILYQNGYGFANVEKRIPITTHTKFKLGSITKQFTAAAILRLQEDGRLNINDNLAKYIPDFPRSKEVTLYQLLTHTSGIHDYFNKPDFFQRIASYITTQELIDYFKNDPYDFNPGDRFQYCNSGYILLGRIIEKVSGQRYADYLRQTFFLPLGMKNTGVYYNGIQLDHEALGYFYANGNNQPSFTIDMAWCGSAGALYSTVEDLFRWNEGLFSGKVLKPESIKAAFTPGTNRQTGTTDTVQGYGLGWFVGKLRNQKEYQHAGSVPGFTNYLMRLPQENLTVVVLSNSSPPLPGVSPDNLGRTVAQMYTGMKMAWATEYHEISPPAETILTSYVGRYDLGGQTTTVSRLGNRMFIQGGNLPYAEIFPLSDTNFLMKVPELTIDFNHFDKGRIAGFTLNNSGIQHKAIRIEDVK